MSLLPITPPELPDTDSEQQPVNLTPIDPGTPPRRIPNIGHALLFVAFTGLLLIVIQLTLSVLGKPPASLKSGVITVEHPILQIAAMAVTYLSTLVAAWFFFPILWHRSFLSGLQWNWPTARGQAPRLVALGIVLGITMQIVTYFITAPRTMPIDEFFLTPATAWIITLFGTIAAPIFEEICFRGFLVPAFAIAYDWLALPRTDAARTRWQTNTNLTPGALIFSAFLSSVFFALLHAQQVAHLWTALLALFSISLVLTFVRVKTQSVAASAIVHSAYNGFVFLTVLVATGGYRHLDRMIH